MLGPRNEIAWLQSDFYRVQYHKMLRWLMMTLVLIVCVIAGIAYQILVNPSTQYYANTVDGLMLPMPPARTS